MGKDADIDIVAEYGAFICLKHGVMQPGPQEPILTDEWANLLLHLMHKKCNVYEQMTKVAMDILHWGQYDIRTILVANNLCGVLGRASADWRAQVLQDHAAYIQEHGPQYPDWDWLVSQLRKAHSDG